MAALLTCLLFALQESPEIQEIRTITGGCVRSGCWFPLKIRIGGPAGFEGEVVGSADSGFRVSRAVKIPAGGAVDVLLPVVLLARDAKVDVVLRGRGGDIGRKSLGTPLQFLNRERLVLIDPRHLEFDAWHDKEVSLPNGTPVRIVASDPADWNEAAEMGALEAVDAVVASNEKSVDLALAAWQALGGALVTEPRRDLLKRLEEPAARFPLIDPAVGRFAVTESWIPRKRDSTLLFIVIYGFGFFVAVYGTGSRRGGAWALALSAIGMSGLFVGAYAAFYPKGHLAFRSWQAVVDAPEGPVAISVSALRGEGRAGDLRFGRHVKPVYATAREAALRPLELHRGGEGRWVVRGAAPGHPVRFVSVEPLRQIEPYKPYLDDKGEAKLFGPDEPLYFHRVPRKRSIRLQDPATAPDVPASAAGVVDSEVARVFRVELRR